MSAPPEYVKAAEATLDALNACLHVTAVMGFEAPRFRLLPKEIALAAPLSAIGMGLAVNPTAKIVMASIIDAAIGFDVTYMMFRLALETLGVETETCGLADLGLTQLGTTGVKPS